MSEMPEFPTRGAMEWHDDLKTYIDALRSRGTLPDDTDLDTLTDNAHAGVWQLSSTNTYHNTPFDIVTTAVLVVERGGGNAIVHRVTMGGINRPSEAWREFNSPSLGWHAWQRGLISDGGVTRVVTSTNYEHPIGEGELLVVTPGDRWWTDFRDDDVGQLPAGWSQKWATPDNPWSVEEAPGSPSGKVLRAEDTGLARTALAWDDLGTLSDVEILVMYRSATPQASARPTIRASGGVGTENSYHQYLAANSLCPLIGALVDGLVTNTPIDLPSSGWEPFKWAFVRLRAFGTRIKTKHWMEGTAEPDVWRVELSNSDLASGWVGLQRSTQGRIDVAWVGVATDGGQAPMGPV